MKRGEKGRKVFEATVTYMLPACTRPSGVSIKNERDHWANVADADVMGVKVVRRKDLERNYCSPSLTG